MPKKRIDKLLVEKELAGDIKEAQALIMARKVKVNDQMVVTAGTRIDSLAKIDVKSKLPYVSRGGYKLSAALEKFKVEPSGLICADVGASTGGFTDVLLQHDARKVYSIDVGYGDLAWKLRQDTRVIVMERTNARNVTILPDKIDLVVADASFISITVILTAALKWTQPEADFIILVKPQFEAKREQVEKGGVVRKKEVHQAVLLKVIAWSELHHLNLVDLIASPITGPAGNREFLLHLSTKPTQTVIATTMVETCLQALNYDF